MLRATRPSGPGGPAGDRDDAVLSPSPHVCCLEARHRQTAALARIAQVACWVLGEYGALAEGGATAARDRLVAVGEAAALSDSTRGYLLSALAKLAVQAGVPLGPGGEELLAAAATSHSADLQQRALELRALLACAPGRPARDA